ncbi:MAG: biotin/lipoate A/B protein ligase family protein [Actinomycetota bacterium]
MRLIEPSLAGAVENMAIDEAMLECSILFEDTEPKLRVYTWADPTLSLGSNMTLPAGTLERASMMGLDMVRRPTGGGAVVHRGDVTYSFVAPDPGGSTTRTYMWIADALLRAFEHLGLDAQVSQHAGPADALACFSRPTGADISIGGRKICGSAQVRRRGWLLQHGSIPMTDCRALTRWLLRHDEQDSSTHLGALAPGASQALVMSAIASGFAATFGAVANDPSPDLAAAEAVMVESLMSAHRSVPDEPARWTVIETQRDQPTPVAEPSSYALESG